MLFHCHSYLLGKLCEACTTETCLGMLMGEGIATVRKNYYRHSDRGPTGPDVNVAGQKRILWGGV